MPAYRSHVLLCAGGACISCGCLAVRDALEQGTAAAGPVG